MYISVIRWKCAWYIPSVSTVNVVVVVDKEELNRPLVVKVVKVGRDEEAGEIGINVDKFDVFKAAKQPIVIFEGLWEVAGFKLDFKANDLIDLMSV